MTLHVGIYVYPEVEVLDFAGPYEVFSTASRVFARGAPDAPPPFAVALVAESKEVVRARAGFAVVPHLAIGEEPQLDILVVPGGVQGPELEKPRVVDWIARQAAKARLTASVCTGAFLLAKAGLLDGLEVTTHWEDCADLARDFPRVAVREGLRWTEHERIMTSAGISAGIDMSLRVVARFAGAELAGRTARQMDYDWRRAAGGA
jgi:transcriptional regulator GlxA family with amidase domain